MTTRSSGERWPRGWERHELLFGRRTYEILRAAWAEPVEPNPFTEVLNDTPKYVASNTLEDRLPWANSTVLEGDAVEEIAKLKGTDGKDLVLMGSGKLAQGLMEAGLIDAFTLLIHPVVLGEGRQPVPRRRRRSRRWRSTSSRRPRRAWRSRPTGRPDSGRPAVSRVTNAARRPL